MTPISRTVSWTVTATVMCGDAECSWCGTRTPPPPNDVVIAWVRKHPTVHWLWPNADARDGWQPEGWDHNRGEWLCPPCADAENEATKAAHAKRRAEVKP